MPVIDGVDYLCFDDADELDGLRQEHVLADKDRPLILEIGGARYTSREEWRRFLRWKEADAYYKRSHRGRSVPDDRPVCLVERGELAGGDGEPAPAELSAA